MKTLITCSLALFLLSSCSSALRVSPLRCDSHQKWSADKSSSSDQSFSFTRTVSTNWFFGDVKRVRLDKFFEEEGITCGSISSLNVEVVEDFTDILSSLFLLPSKQLIITGTHIASSDDDDRVLSIEIKDD